MEKVHRYLIKQPWVWCALLLAAMFLLSLGTRYGIPEVAPLLGDRIPFEAVLLLVAILYEVFRRRDFSGQLILTHFYLTFLAFLILSAYLIFDFNGNVDLFSDEPVPAQSRYLWMMQTGVVLFFAGQLVFLINFVRALSGKRVEAVE